MSDLAKTLSPLRGGALMLNIVVGAGLLTLPGLVVASAGDQALWAWGACALAAIPLLLVFIIMGRRFPHAGGIAHFAAMAFGPAAYAIASFIFLGAVAFGLPAIALTGGYYLAEIIPVHPAIFAAGLIISATLVNLISTETAGRLSTVIASTIILSLLVLIVIGFSAIDWNQPAYPIRPLADIDLNQVFLPFMLIFFAFTGWEVAANTAEEFKDPARDFPRAMVMSFIAACLIYFAMAFVVQNVPISGSYKAPFVSIVGQVLSDKGEWAVALLAGVIIFANLLGAIWAVSRMIFSLDREGYLSFALAVNKNGSPTSSVVVTMVGLLLVLLLDWVGVLGINQMLSLAGQNFFILYGIVGLALFRLAGNFAEKVLSMVTVVIVLGLLSMQGVSVFYPLGLSVAALIIWYCKKRGYRIGSC